MSEKRKVIKGTTPVGSSMWFKLTKPDQKFKKYQVDLILEDSPELQNMLNQIEELTEEVIKEAKSKQTDKAKLAKMKGDSGNRPIEKEMDSEGNHTGRYVLKFRGKSEGKRKDESVYQIPSPTIFNSQAKPLSKEDKEVLRVPNGSLIKIAYELKPYYVASIGGGVSLEPKAAMLIKLQAVESASQFGFSASEMETEHDESDNEEFASEEKSNDDEQDF